MSMNLFPKILFILLNFSDYNGLYNDYTIVQNLNKLLTS